MGSIHAPRSGRRDVGPLAIALIVATVALLVAAIIYGMANEPDQARKTLIDRGYTAVEILPRRPYQKACGRSRGIAPGFTARRTDGMHVSGFVCISPIFTDVVVETAQ